MAKKRKKKSDNQKTLYILLLITAILELLKSILDIIENHLE